MAYENPSKTDLKNKGQEVLSNFPETLTEAQAEDLVFTLYEELCKTVNPDKEYPPVRF